MRDVLEEGFSMPLVTSTEMFKKVYGKCAVGAFNVNNMEMIQGFGFYRNVHLR